jgi:hypothetical protein
MLIVLGAITLGVALGRAHRRRTQGEGGEGVGSVVASVLGLLAFLLGFTFGIAANRFADRKEVLLDDVNAIRKVARAATLLPEPHRQEVRALLARYVELRLAVTPRTSEQEIADKIAETERLQNALWAHAGALRAAGYDTELGAIFVTGLGDLMEAHTRRSTVVFVYRIPPRIWKGLLLVTVCAMVLVGYQFGLAGRNNFIVQLLLSIGFASVVALISDLDRADGAVQVNQRPMQDLQRELASATP